MRSVLSVLTLIVLLLTAGCTSGPSTGNAQAPVEAIKSGAAVIDVRTPQEFATGHVQGAKNIDVQASTFDTEIAKLDKNATYVVYCRSGNRSAAAIKKMTAAGFTSLIDGKGFDGLKAGGAPTA